MFKLVSRLRSFSLSAVVSLATGILVQSSTTLAKFSKVNVDFFTFFLSSSNLDLSEATSTSYTQYLCGYTCEEMLNVKINSSLSYSSYSPFFYNQYGTYQLRRIVMDPTQQGMPAELKIGLYAADKEGIIEFFESLPYITTDCVLTIYNYALYNMPAEDVLAIAVEKGYTVSFTK